MKKFLLKFADQMLSKTEMQEIKGGYPNGRWASYCSYNCMYENSGGQGFYSAGWFGGSPSQNEGHRLPGTGVGTGMVCVIVSCSYKKM